MRDGGLTTDPWVGRPEHFTRNTGYIEVGYLNDFCHRFHSAHDLRNFRYPFFTVFYANLKLPTAAYILPHIPYFNGYIGQFPNIDGLFDPICLAYFSRLRARLDPFENR
jgi:hypothetical protein